MAEKGERFNPNNEFANRIQRLTGTDPNVDIKDRYLYDTVVRIGDIAAMGMVDKNLLREEFLHLNELQREKQKNSQPGYPAAELNPIMAALGGWVQELDAIAQKNDPMRQMADNQRRTLEAELQELIAGQDDFFRSIYYQTAGSDELGRETWYNSLSPNEQILLRLQNKFLFAQNGTDAIPGRKAGPIKGFDAYKSFLHIRKEELGSLFQSEGFNLAFGTIRHDLFEWGELNPDKKSTEPDMYGLVLSDTGKSVIRDQDSNTREQKFNNYREETIKKLVRYFTQHPNEVEFGLLNYPNLSQEMRTKQIRVAAEAYFGMAWNTLSIGNAVESGDATRKVSSSDPTVIVPAWRNMIHPHDQAKNKWVKGVVEKIGLDEDLFGILGRWFQERIRHSPEFKKKFEEYQPGFRYFQRVTTGSLFDHSYFADNQTNLSWVFCYDTNLTTVDLGNGEILHRFDGSTINFGQLRDADIGYVYTDILDSVIKIQTLITTPEGVKDPKASFSNLLGAIQGLQGRAYDIDKKVVTDDLLYLAYEPDEIEDMIVAGIGAIAGGFMQYSNELILISSNYDGLVSSLLSDDKLYKLFGLNIGSSQIKFVRQRLLERLNAHDTSTRQGSERATQDKAGRGPRSKIIRQAAKEANRWIKG